MLSNTPLPTLRDEYLKKKRNRKLLRYGLFGLIFFMVVGLLAYIAHRPELTITEVELTGGVLVTQAEVEAHTLEYIQGAYLWVFPIRNAFWYPKGQLEKYLLESFKRIDTIDVHLTNFNTLQVDIEEKKPFATWCDKSSAVPKCFFMDENSAIFAEAPSFSGDAYFKYFGLVSGEQPLGQYYLASTTQFQSLVKMVELAKKLSLRPQYLEATGKDEFSMVISGGGKIYFDLANPISETIENFEALLKTAPFAGMEHENLPIDYIDLRFGNKLYYILK